MKLPEHLSYDPATGIFTWTAPGRKRRVGERAGSVAANGYRSIGIGRVRYYEHRLAWLAVHGAWPQHEIDHINGNPSDNAMSNLRAATHQENTRNVKRHADNKSGVKGAHYDPRRGKWYATISGVWLGYWPSKESAYAAYCAAAKDQFGEFSRIGELLK